LLYYWLLMYLFLLCGYLVFCLNNFTKTLIVIERVEQGRVVKNIRGEVQVLQYNKNNAVFIICSDHYVSNSMAPLSYHCQRKCQAGYLP